QCPFLDHVGWIQQVATNADCRNLVSHWFECGEHTATSTSNVVSVHRMQKCRVACCIEARHQFVPVHLQPTRHLVYARCIGSTTETAFEPVRRAIAEHCNHARECKTITRATKRECMTHEGIPGNTLCGLHCGCTKHARLPHSCGIRCRKLKCNHASQRTANHEARRVHVECIEKTCEHSCLVARRDNRCNLCPRTIPRNGPGTSAEHVGTENCMLRWVECFALSNNSAPPIAGMRVAG